MKERTVTMPQIGMIAVTRTLLGAGVGMLIADKIGKENSKRIGIPLMALGAISTIPLVMSVLHENKPWHKDQASNLSV